MKFDSISILSEMFYLFTCSTIEKTSSVLRTNMFLDSLQLLSGLDFSGTAFDLKDIGMTVFMCKQVDFTNLSAFIPE